MGVKNQEEYFINITFTKDGQRQKELVPKQGLLLSHQTWFGQHSLTLTRNYLFSEFTANVLYHIS